MAFGILALGAYIPRLRLARSAIAQANLWFNPGLKGQAKGARAMANWDEDAVTMAVEAARDALTGRDVAGVASLRVASTTFPFLDRLNAGIVAGALGLAEAATVADASGSQRAGTTALRDALKGGETALIAAADHRIAKAASAAEIMGGDGAAAFLVGEGAPIAKLLGSATANADFVDHYRTAEMPYDYQWEERWIRDAGFLKLVPPVIARCLAEAGVKPAEIDVFCLPTTIARCAQGVAKAAGIAEAAVCDPLRADCGDTGAAHGLLLLAAAIEQAKPGTKILLVGFGQGADALLFEVTGRAAPARGVAGSLARRKDETNYLKFLAFNGLIDMELGMRAEADKQTALSSQWRNRDTVTAFHGGKCTKCGTVQFPRSRICVNPNCGARDSQEPYAFAGLAGRIASYTADQLTFSPDPPACYGMVTFAEGGRWMMDFTDVDADQLEVGQAVGMMFRIKDIDTQRGYRRYFWKAAPRKGS